MITIGLTGSIGMGKSTAAAMLRRLGAPMFDADAEVHRLLGPGGAAVAAVEAAFPGVRNEAGGIDRRRLGEQVFGRSEALRRLERILHPVVRAAEIRFVGQSRARRRPLIVLDIPLLFETRADALCDAIVVVTAPPWLQRRRVLRRPGMTPARLAGIIAAQMPDREKRRHADFVVETGLGRGLTLRRLAAALRKSYARGIGGAGRGCDARCSGGGGSCVREIVIDTETTELDPLGGHRIVEIAAVELVHHVPTGRKFHCYVNPERDMPADAYAVHGLDGEFLAGFTTFDTVADELVAFISGDPLVAHNAEFDLAFLNAELQRVGRTKLAAGCVDTLALARRRFPGAPASLDALCRRFSIDLAGREKHGAEIDCALLAEVYIELLGGRQPALDLAINMATAITTTIGPAPGPARPPRPHAASAEELAAHAAMVATLKSPLWLAEFA